MELEPNEQFARYVPEWLIIQQAAWLEPVVIHPPVYAPTKPLSVPITSPDLGFSVDLASNPDGDAGDAVHWPTVARPRCKGQGSRSACIGYLDRLPALDGLPYGAPCDGSS